MTMTILSRSVARLLFLFGLFFGSAHADKIYLANGSTLEGDILEETADAVRLRYHVTPRIQDEKMVPKSTIVKIEKVAPDARALEKIQEMLPMADRSPALAYDDFINRQLRSFKTKFPESELHGQIDKMISDLKAEKERVATGDVKINGAFVSPKEYDMDRKRFESEAAVGRFKSKIEAGKFIEGMRIFRSIEEEYIGTVALVDAIEYARDKALPTFERSIGQMIQLDQVKSDEVARIRRLAVEGDNSAKRAVIEIDKQIDAFKEVQKAEGTQKFLWGSHHPYFPATLQKTEVTIKKEHDRLAEIDVELLREANSEIEAARRNLAEGDHVKAIASLMKAELKEGDEAVIKELRSEALGFKKTAEEAEAKVAEAKAAKEKGLSGLFEKASGAMKSVTGGSGGGDREGGPGSIIKQNRDALAAANGQAPGGGTPPTAPAVAPTPPAAGAAPAPKPPASAAPVVAAAPPVQSTGGVPLWQKALFGLALLMILFTLGAKVLGIGSGKKAASEEG